MVKNRPNLVDIIFLEDVVRLIYSFILMYQSLHVIDGKLTNEVLLLDILYIWLMSYLILVMTDDQQYMCHSHLSEKLFQWCPRKCVTPVPHMGLHIIPTYNMILEL